MKYVNVNEIAAKWNLSERSVRNYCAHGKIPGVILDGKTWRIPEDAVKPVRKKRAEKIANDLLTRLKMEKEAGRPGGIYHKVQIELTYNSNHMEGSRLTHDQTRYIFETNTIGIQDEVVNVDDIVETVRLLAGSFGGVNLEDISAPRCFEIEKKLKECCDIPIFHDDQHGTAVITLAGVINALKVVGKKIEDIKIVTSGAGAAGIAIIKLLISMGL